MRRPLFLLAWVLALAACRRNAATMPEIFGEAIGAWHRTSVTDLPPSAATGVLSATPVERIRTATYEGPGRLEARMYQLSTAAAAIDVVQHWKPAPDTVFFYSDRFFVVIQW
jgi:hypothetical protein